MSTLGIMGLSLLGATVYAITLVAIAKVKVKSDSAEYWVAIALLTCVFAVGTFLILLGNK